MQMSLSPVTPASKAVWAKFTTRHDIYSKPSEAAIALQTANSKLLEA